MKVECKTCDGTGLYEGFAEPEGYAVICNSCEGRGWVNAAVGTPFTGRKSKHGIKFVYCDGGLWMMRQEDKPPKTITVQEFYNKVKE